jgi:hypothetical protein
MKRTMFSQAVLAATLACTIGLSACGGSSSDSAASGGGYCDEVKALGDFETRLSSLDQSDMKASVQTISDVAAQIKDVSESAPDDIKSEWSTVAGVFGELATAMKPLTELDLSDPTKVDPEQLAALQELAPKMESMTKDMTAATDKIDEHTTKECGFSLGQS